MKDIPELSQIATQVRRDILRMVHAPASGHPGGSLGCTDFFTAMYFNILNHNPDHFTFEANGQDMFFLSNGHLSAVWYSVLARSGYFPVNELATFRYFGSRLQGHPTPDKHIPGVRIASGSLGMGISVSIGAAINKKLNNDSSLVFCLTGDGELQEGQIWEAAMFAAAKKVDNLVVVVDYNKKQIDGPTDEVLSLGDLHAKWQAFGWNVLEMNGNDMANVLQTMQQAKDSCNKLQPVVVLMKTEMGAGVDFMMGTHKWHGSAPNDEQLAKALSQLPETIGDY
ncbi:MAG: transketolase [Bacteroidetes bacterium]|nr:transketolase [Bacteroidota bacterium]MBU1720708.1 transketolase [Bacteroidota bacterium]